MSQLFGFPSGLSGGSKETSYNTLRSTDRTTTFNTDVPASRSTSYSTLVATGLPGGAQNSYFDMGSGWVVRCYWPIGNIGLGVSPSDRQIGWMMYTQGGDLNGAYVGGLNQNQQYWPGYSWQYMDLSVPFMDMPWSSTSSPWYGWRFKIRNITHSEHVYIQNAINLGGPWITLMQGANVGKIANAEMVPTVYGGQWMGMPTDGTYAYLHFMPTFYPPAGINQLPMAATVTVSGNRNTTYTTQRSTSRNTTYDTALTTSHITYG